MYVDNIWLYYVWHCHSLPDRSFNIEGRQFHVCARCTGILGGMLGSILLLPIQKHLIWPFAVSTVCLGADGLTQLLRFRTSNNTLRLMTGMSFGLTALPALIAVGSLLCHK